MSYGTNPYTCWNECPQCGSDDIKFESSFDITARNPFFPFINDTEDVTYAVCNKCKHRDEASNFVDGDVAY